MGKGDNEALEAKLESMVIDEEPGAPRLVNDVLQGMRYTAMVGLLAEFMILSQLSNVNYMVYAGVEARVASCGDMVFNETTIEKERCAFVRTNSCHPELTSQFRSVNVEFEYYCERNKVVKDSISYQMIGIIIGSIVMGQISDIYGRKLSMLICLIGCATLGAISSFANSLFTLTLIRAALLFFNGGQIAVLLVFLVENVAQKNRMWLSALISWSPNNAIFAIIAYLSTDWRMLARITSVLIIPAIVVCFLMQESPRWLIQKGKYVQARHALKKILRFNNAKASNETVLNIVANERKALLSKPNRKSQYFLHHLFMWKSLALHTFVFSFSYMSISIINYGLFFNMAKVPGSIYINNIYIGLCRWVINICCGIADFKLKWFSRKAMHNSSLFVIALAAASIWLMNTIGLSKEYVGLARIAMLSISVMTNQVYIVNNVSSNELFPTPIRNVAFSFLQVMNRLGVVIAPQLFFLGDVVSPFMVMFVMATIDLLCFQWGVPETKARPLSDSMPPDNERFCS